MVSQCVNGKTVLFSMFARLTVGKHACRGLYKCVCAFIYFRVACNNRERVGEKLQGEQSTSSTESPCDIIKRQTEGQRSHFHPKSTQYTKYLLYLCFCSAFFLIHVSGSLKPHEGQDVNHTCFLCSTSLNDGDSPVSTVSFLSGSTLGYGGWTKLN